MAGAQAALESAALNLGFTRVTSPIAGRASRAEVTRGNLVTGGSNGGTLLSSVVSMDPIYLYFDGDEQATCATRRWRARAARSSRDAPDPVQVGLANEEGFPHQVPSISSTINSIRKPAPFARAPCSTTKTANSRPACSRACNCWRATSTRRS